MKTFVIVILVTIALLIGYVAGSYSEQEKQELREQIKNDSLAEENYRSMID